LTPRTAAALHYFSLALAETVNTVPLHTLVKMFKKKKKRFEC